MTAILSIISFSALVWLIVMTLTSAKKSARRFALNQIRYSLAAILLSFIGIIIISYKDNNDEKGTRTSRIQNVNNVSTETKPEAVITKSKAEPAPETYEPYTRKGYAKTFKKWGDGGIKRVNLYRKKAAFAVAQNERCDKVDYAEISDNRSTPPNSIVIFVDCANGQRFFISSDELDKGVPTESTQSKTEALNDVDLISACEHAVRSSLKFPSSMDKSWFSSSVYRAPQGNVVVTFDFSAKNGFGLELPQQARCVTDDQGMHPPERYNR